MAVTITEATTPTAAPTATTAPTPTRPHRTAATVVLHGRHPMRGYPVTWRITPLTAPGTTTTFVVQRADGHLDGDTAWQAAEKETSLMDVHAVRELVRRTERR